MSYPRKGTANVSTHSTSRATGRGPLSLAFILYFCGEMALLPGSAFSKVQPDLVSRRRASAGSERPQKLHRSEKVPERCPRVAPFEGLRVSPRDLKIVIVGRSPIFASTTAVVRRLGRW